MRKKINVTGIVLICVGLMMGLQAAAAYTNLGYDHRRIAQDSERVTATVTNFGWSQLGQRNIMQASGRYIVYVVDGVVIRARYSHTSKEYVNILVNRQNPYEFVSARAGYWVYVGILLGLMVMFVGIGVWLLVTGKRIQHWLEGWAPASIDMQAALRQWCVTLLPQLTPWGAGIPC